MRLLAVTVALSLAAGHVAADPSKPRVRPPAKPMVVEVRTAAPKPNVLIVQHGGRSVTGRPRSGDRLAGLSHHLE